MLFISKKCTNCNKPVPESTTVGSRCPHCGVLFGGERTEYHTMPERNESFDFPKVVFIAILAYAALSLILPFILIFALDIDRGGFFYLNYVCIAAAIASSAAIMITYIRKIMRGNFDWSEYMNPGIFFIGICWSVINLLIVVSIFLNVINGQDFAASVISLGLAGLIGGGVIAAVAGVILALPIMLYYEFKNL